MRRAEPEQLGLLLQIGHFQIGHLGTRDVAALPHRPALVELACPRCQLVATTCVPEGLLVSRPGLPDAPLALAEVPETAQLLLRFSGVSERSVDRPAAFS